MFDGSTHAHLLRFDSLGHCPHSNASIGHLRGQESRQMLHLGMGRGEGGVAGWDVYRDCCTSVWKTNLCLAYFNNVIAIDFIIVYDSIIQKVSMITAKITGPALKSCLGPLQGFLLMMKVTAMYQAVCYPYFCFHT